MGTGNDGSVALRDSKSTQNDPRRYLVPTVIVTSFVASIPLRWLSMMSSRKLRGSRTRPKPAIVLISDDDGHFRLPEEPQRASFLRNHLKTAAFRFDSALHEDRLSGTDIARYRRDRLAALAEERKMEEEKRIQEELNRRKQEEEEQARIKLALEEENLRLMLEKEYQERQMELMKRREHNLELRTDLQQLHHRQQLTRPWVFSYFVHWPRDLFERPIGGEPAKPKRFRFPAKSAPKNNDSLPPL